MVWLWQQINPYKGINDQHIFSDFPHERYRRDRAVPIKFAVEIVPISTHRPFLSSKNLLQKLLFFQPDLSPYLCKRRGPSMDSCIKICIYLFIYKIPSHNFMLQPYPEHESKLGPSIQIAREKNLSSV